MSGKPVWCFRSATFLSPPPHPPLWELGCLFVCEGGLVWGTNRKTGRQFVCVRKSDGIYPGACLNGFSRAPLNGKPLPVVFVHKRALLFFQGTIERFTKSQRARTISPLPCRVFSLFSSTHKHPAPSLCLNPVSVTFVWYQSRIKSQMFLPPLFGLFHSNPQQCWRFWEVFFKWSTKKQICPKMKDANQCKSIKAPLLLCCWKLLIFILQLWK